jgi:uroporphyrin-III C-methyltransferase/precorrin-2 dehydrogenase/sirohydrochlorin ferrochelatase
MWTPLFLRFEGRDVLVVGGGEIALRKAGELARSGARVTIVAPECAGPLPDGARWLRRAFEPRDVDGAWLVVAATDDADVQRAVAIAAENARIFVLAVDDLANASAISPATIRRGPVTIAISSAGQAPALTRLLREIVERILPDETYVTAARTLRARWKRDRVPMKSRFPELLLDLTAKTPRTPRKNLGFGNP